MFLLFLPYAPIIRPMTDERPPKQKIYFLLLIVTLFLGLVVTASTGVREKMRIIEKRNEKLNEIMKTLELQFSSFQQNIATTAVLAGKLPQTREANEIFLTSIFSSSRSSLLYGIGIWYEPGQFMEKTTWYGPYVRRSTPSSEDWFLTYERNTPEYDYPNQAWYMNIWPDWRTGRSA